MGVWGGDILPDQSLHVDQIIRVITHELVLGRLIYGNRFLNGMLLKKSRSNDLYGGWRYLNQSSGTQTSERYSGCR